MDVVFHSVFVWPIQAVVEFLYLSLNQWTDHHVGVALVLLSLAVNVLLLPLYLVADRWQKEEKKLLASMAPKLAQIRAVFQGDERHMMVSTYYRQNGYHPLLSLRSSVGLLMQIPFFLAAYNVLSHAGGLKTSVWVLQDLSLPDGLLHLGGLSINLLPLVMTAINLLSAAVYARGQSLKDNVQLLVFALVFLVLLYGSPSGLVLYWTVNNAFSLVKNIVSRRPNPSRVFHVLALLTVALVGAWQVFAVRRGVDLRSLDVVLALAFVGLAPSLWRRVVRAASGPLTDEPTVFRWGTVTLFVLAGLTVPALFVGAAPGEVPGAGWALVRTALQVFSLTVLLPWGLWAMASLPFRRLLTWAVAAVALLGLVSSFVLPPHVSLNASFTVTNPEALSGAAEWLTSAMAVVVVFGVLVALVLLRRERWLTSFFTVVSSALVLVSVFTWVTLPPPPPAPVRVTAHQVTPVFPLTRTGHNQFFIFIDGFPSVAFPEMLESVPQLKASLEGFVWHDNTLSYASNTFETTPALLGGPAYTPDAINARKGESLEQKHHEAQATLPRLLSAAGQRVVLSDPWYVGYDSSREYAHFRQLPGVSAIDLHGVYSDLYFGQHPIPGESSPLNAFDYDMVSRFSVFRLTPPALRAAVYDDARWWKSDSGAHVSDFVLGGYPNLVYLPQLTHVDDGADSANFFFSEVFHDTGAFDRDGVLQSKSVDVPPADLERFGNVYSARNIYDGRAVMRALLPWLQSLKDQGVYDRTRIVIVSDHGHPLHEGKFGPQPFLRPLVLVKDYDAREPLRVDTGLTTNADVPALFSRGLPGAIAPRAPDDVPKVRDGANHALAPDSQEFALGRGWSLRHPDSRDPANWEEIHP